MKTENKKEFEQAQDAILEELKASKINGFPFFSYTGISNFVFTGGGKNMNGEVLHDYELILKGIPKNPNGITTLKIVYKYGADLYQIQSFKGKEFLPSTTYEDIFVGQLAEICARDMGVL